MGTQLARHVSLGYVAELSTFLHTSRKGREAWGDTGGLGGVSDVEDRWVLVGSGDALTFALSSLRKLRRDKYLETF